MSTRSIHVDRRRTPTQVMEAFKDLGFSVEDRLSANCAMARYGSLYHYSGPDDVEVEFFVLDHTVTYHELALEYEKRSLKSDPYAFAQVFLDDPSLLSPSPTSAEHVEMVWKCSDGDWYFIMVLSPLVPDHGSPSRSFVAISEENVQGGGFCRAGTIFAGVRM